MADDNDERFVMEFFEYKYEKYLLVYDRHTEKLHGFLENHDAMWKWCCTFDNLKNSKNTYKGGDLRDFLKGKSWSVGNRIVIEGEKLEDYGSCYSESVALQLTGKLGIGTTAFAVISRKELIDDLDYTEACIIHNNQTKEFKVYFNDEDHFYLIGYGKKGPGRSWWICVYDNINPIIRHRYTKQPDWSSVLYDFFKKMNPFVDYDDNSIIKFNMSGHIINYELCGSHRCIIRDWLFS